MAVLATTIAWTQQNFPFKPGLWESKTSNSKIHGSYKQLLCLNDENWAKLMVQTGVGDLQHCSSHATVTDTGVSGDGNCSYSFPTQYAPMGDPQHPLTDTFGDTISIEISFDGMTHMIGSGEIKSVETSVQLGLPSIWGTYTQVGPPLKKALEPAFLQFDYRWKSAKCRHRGEKLKQDAQ